MRARLRQWSNDLRADWRSRDLVIAPLCEAALLIVAGLAAWVSHRPLLFASLGPTIYELVEQPHRESARPYNLIVGHLVGVLAGFAGLAVSHAWTWPAVTGITDVALARVWAAGLAGLLTVFGTTLLQAMQPAAISTSLVIALGSMQQWQDGPIIMVSILLMTALGEPVRRWRDNHGTGATSAGAEL